MYLIDPAESIDVAIEQQHFGFHPLGNPGAVPTDVTRTDDYDASWADARDAAEEDATGAVSLLEEARSHLRCDAPGHFTHRSQQR